MLKVPLFKLIDNKKLRLNLPKLVFRPEEISYNLTSKIESLKQEVKSLKPEVSVKKPEIDIKNSEILSRIDNLERYLQKELNDFQSMNMCEDLLTNKSLHNFEGDIKSKYIKLIKGLDEKSVNTVTLILSRLRHFRKTSINEFRFTESEKKRIDEHL